MTTRSKTFIGLGTNLTLCVLWGLLIHTVVHDASVEAVTIVVGGFIIGFIGGEITHRWTLED